MKRTRILMGTPITIEVVDEKVKEADFASAFDYFAAVDMLFNPRKKESEIARLNSGKLSLQKANPDIKLLLTLAEDTKNESHGYFNCERKGKIDLSGLVKGWAIYNAANVLRTHELRNFMIDADGDVQVNGKNATKSKWTYTVSNPLNPQEVAATFVLHENGLATAGRDQHIYNPHRPDKKVTSLASMTVIGPTVYDAKRFAIAAFAMGEKGVHFIEKQEGLEAYSINSRGKVITTTGIRSYLTENYEPKSSILK